MGIIMLGAVASCIWVYIHREHRVLRAAQPIALYVIAFGSAVSASSIFVISFDENEGWTEEQLSRACMTMPWLLSLGHIITYGALFSKLWRVNEVLQFSRRKIDMKHVAWPFAMLTFVILVVLSLWTALDSLQWIRVELDESTGESIGGCESEQIFAFLVPLAVLVLIPTVLTGCMAWKTKDIDEVYSDSQWIFILFVSQIEIILVAVPTIVVLKDVSADGRYIGLAFLIWSFPAAALGFIILPKVVAYYRAIRGNDRNNVPKRGNATGTVHVTGLTTSSQDRVQLHSDAAGSYGGEPTEQPSDKESS
jgi:gamma-aminobutyric acid type B receptor